MGVDGCVFMGAVGGVWVLVLVLVLSSLLGPSM